MQVHSSGKLMQALLQQNLVDELWLKIIPLTLESDQKLFADGTIQAIFTLANSKDTLLGVLFANYKRAGEVKTGLFM